jgi:hypothetical protein
MQRQQIMWMHNGMNKKGDRKEKDCNRAQKYSIGIKIWIVSTHTQNNAQWTLENGVSDIKHKKEGCQRQENVKATSTGVRTPPMHSGQGCGSICILLVNKFVINFSGLK